MKKVLIVGLIVGMLITAGSLAFADNTSDVPQWYEDMLKWREGEIDEAVKSGEITEEQANYFRENLEQAQSFQNDNTSNFFGFGRGMMNWGSRGSNGFGPGMMWGSNNNNGFNQNTSRNGFTPGRGFGFCHGW